MRSARSAKHGLAAIVATLLAAASLLAQSRHRPTGNAANGVLIGIVARRDDQRNAPITSKEVSVYDNGIEQSIRNFTPDPSPARIALPAHNSFTFRAVVAKL